MHTEWMILRNASIEDARKTIEQIVLAHLGKELNAPRRPLAELSPWLVANEVGSPGFARAIRNHFKVSCEIWDFLENSVFAEIAEDLCHSTVGLHGSAKSRTVMRMQEFSHSRPHQDLALWPDTPHHFNMWLPLCNVDDGLAPLQLISHPGG